MAAIDHLVFTSRDLDAGVRQIAEATGATAVVGGPHPGIGTRNALLSFDDATYFEIMAIDPDQPEPERERPFGLDLDRPPRLAGYVIRPTGTESIDELAGRMADAGFAPGPVVSMSRTQPDGTEVGWRLTYGGDPTPPASGLLPFVIDWGDTPSPARSAPSMGSLVTLQVSHPDERVRATVASLGAGITVADGPPSLAATIVLPSGESVGLS